MCKNLIKRSGSQCWYFRIAIPVDLQGIIGRKMIKRSLGTADKRKAERMVKSLSSQWKSKFKELRASTTIPVDAAVLEYELADHLDKLQADDKKRRAEPIGPMMDSLARFQSVKGQSASEVSATSKAIWISELQACLVSNDFSLVHNQVEAFMRQNGYAYPPGTIEYNQIARGLIETHIRLNTLTQRRDAGDVLGEDLVRTVAAPSRPAREVVSLNVEVHPVSEIIPLFLNQKSLEDKPIVQTTVDKYTDALNEFIEIMGDMPMADVDHGSIRDYRDTLLKLPVHRNKKAELRDMSVAELLEMDSFKTQSTTTVNGKLSALKGFFDFAKDEGYVSENYVLGKQLKGITNSRVVYQRYSSQDLVSIFLRQSLC